MQVHALMRSAPLTCTLADTLDRAARHMWEGDLGAVPVLEDERVVGMLTDRDLCMASYTQGRPLHQIRVADVTSQRVVSVGPNETIREAARRMREHQVRRLPVLDDDGRLVGMLSLGDLSREASSDEIGRTLSAISAPWGEQPKTRFMDPLRKAVGFGLLALGALGALPLVRAFATR